MEQGQNQEQGLAPHHPLHEVDGIAMVSSQKPQLVLHVHAQVNIIMLLMTQKPLYLVYQLVTTT